MTANDRGIFFDVDGTLVDTSYIHAVTWWQAIRARGYDAEMAPIHRSVGMGGEHLLDNVLPDRNRDDDEALKDGHKGFYKQYWDDLRPLPGARELLRECHSRGLQVVLASSANPDEMDALRRALDVDDAIDDATGAGDASASKPDPDILQVALEKSGLDASSIVFVGDSIWDAVVAGKVDVPFIGVESGGYSAAELRENGAVAVFKNPAEILEHLDRSPLAQLLRG